MGWQESVKGVGRQVERLEGMPGSPPRSCHRRLKSYRDVLHDVVAEDEPGEALGQRGRSCTTFAARCSIGEQWLSTKVASRAGSGFEWPSDSSRQEDRDAWKRRRAPAPKRGQPMTLKQLALVDLITRCEKIVCFEKSGYEWLQSWSRPLREMIVAADKRNWRRLKTRFAAAVLVGTGAAQALLGRGGARPGGSSRAGSASIAAGAGIMWL